MCWQLGMVFSFSKILPPTLHLSPKLFPGPLSRLTWWCVCVSPGDARRWCGVGHRPLSSRYPSARGLTPGDSRLAVATSSPCVLVCVSPNPSLSPLLILAGPFPVVLAAVSNFFCGPPAHPRSFRILISWLPIDFVRVGSGDVAPPHRFSHGGSSLHSLKPRHRSGGTGFE